MNLNTEIRHNVKNVVRRGMPLDSASRVLIMVHGRGATAESILSLADYLSVDGFALLAPQATMNTWYPYSFMAPPAQNQPGLNTALQVLRELTDEVLGKGFDSKDIYFLGFSQGACLTSEFLARHAARYGGAFIFSGGVIGDRLDSSNYRGDFAGTPVFLGCSDVDPHIPLTRVRETVQVFKDMGANVNEQIYPNAPHTVLEEEIAWANGVLES